MRPSKWLSARRNEKAVMPLPRIKVCCISSIDEAQEAVRRGAAALGFVAEMPSGPGVIADELIAAIVATVPPPVGTFLLTARTDADAIVEHHAVCRTSTLQLVDAVEPAELVKLRRRLPQVKLVQVIHVIGEQSVDEAKRIAGLVDALLLDSGNPNLPVKALGGTGRVHDWAISRRIREQVARPMFLAGGLHPANVRDAIETVEPFGLDLCSGVRREGKLDYRLLGDFMRAVREAVDTLSLREHGMPRPRATSSTAREEGRPA